MQLMLDVHSRLTRVLLLVLLLLPG